jgi:hypothetical protein
VMLGRSVTTNRQFGQFPLPVTACNQPDVGHVVATASVVRSEVSEQMMVSRRPSIALRSCWHDISVGDPL